MSDPSAPNADELGAAFQRLLAPLARLALARGVTHASLEEWLKLALVEAADAQHAALPPHRRVSRITTATGIHRREVTRLVELLRAGSIRGLAPAARSHASELFHHWRTNPVYCDRKGSPAELPRAGDAPSFESLAHAITRDVHPRSLLDELVRLGLAALDHQRDTVRLVREAFVPQGDPGRMLRALGNNVGSHLDAAVDNVLGGDRRHFEQAIFADGLSEASMVEFRNLVRDQWQTLIAAMVPALEAMLARDQAALASSSDDAPSTAAHQFVRVGLYTHALPTSNAEAMASAPMDSPDRS
jgi:hypothetical protein